MFYAFRGQQSLSHAQICLFTVVLVIVNVQQVSPSVSHGSPPGPGPSINQKAQNKELFEVSDPLRLLREANILFS